MHAPRHCGSALSLPAAVVQYPSLHRGKTRLTGKSAERPLSTQFFTAARARTLHAMAHISNQARLPLLTFKKCPILLPLPDPLISSHIIHSRAIRPTIKSLEISDSRTAHRRLAHTLHGSCSLARLPGLAIFRRTRTMMRLKAKLKYRDFDMAKSAARDIVML